LGGGSHVSPANRDDLNLGGLILPKNRPPVKLESNFRQRWRLACDPLIL
jgi:hypothetical protein